MTEFLKLGLEQRMGPLIVDQIKLIAKFRIEADREYVLGQRNRVGFEQIASGKCAGPSHRLDQLAPHLFEICLASARHICRRRRFRTA